MQCSHNGYVINVAAAITPADRASHNLYALSTVADLYIQHPGRESREMPPITPLIF